METVASGGAAGLGYPDSLDSSPRSRGAESWDEPFPSSAAKLRLMCSYGGRIVPRPTDKSLCYLGGETRIVVVDRLSSLADLSARLSRNLLGGRPFTLKYQLPNEDLDSLISVTTDEDLENMIEEYDRIAASNPSGGSTRSSRLRLFLFSSKPESAPSSINSLLDDSKSETWFVDALNGAMGMVGIDGLSADAASANCLLSLEDDSSVHSRGTAPAAAPAPPELLPRPDSSGKLARHGLDVQSVPDSPMLDNSSSFGSNSSAPPLSNLPPIRVRLDDRPSDNRITAVEDRFAAGGQEALKEAGFAPNPPAPSPPIHFPTGPASTSSISPTENPTRVFSSDDDKSDHGVARKPPPVAYQQKPPPVDDSVTRPMYYQDRPSAATVTAVNPVSDPKRELPVPDPSYGGYVNVMPQMQPEQLQQHHQQQQFIRANPHYVHPTTGAVLPVPSYYQMPHPIQQSQQPHMPMYYLPVRSNAPYNLAAAAGQPNLGDATVTTIPTSLPKLPAKPELPANLYRTAAAAAAAPALQPPPSAPLIHVAADQVHPYGGMGYHVMHHHHPSQAPPAMANYGYEYADPSQPQMYYTQTTSPPGLAPQYQTAMSAATPAIPVTATAPQMQPGEVKQTRAS